MRDRDMECHSEWNLNIVKEMKLNSTKGTIIIIFYIHPVQKCFLSRLEIILLL